MSATMTLAEWLEVQLAADEAVAKAAQELGGAWIGFDAGLDSGHPLADYDPARTLALIAAIRAVLVMHGGGDDDNECQSPRMDGPCRTIRALAKPYAGRDGYAEVAG